MGSCRGGSVRRRQGCPVHSQFYNGPTAGQSQARHGGASVETGLRRGKTPHSIEEQRKKCAKQPCEHPGQRGRRSSRHPSRDSPTAHEDTMVEQVFPCSPQMDGHLAVPKVSPPQLQSKGPVGTPWRSNDQLRTRLAESAWWHATAEAAGQQTPSKLATSDAPLGLWLCAREPTNCPHGPQAPGDAPTLNPGDLEVTAETLSCRPGPLLLLLAQLYFQKAFADTGSTKVSTVHADVDTHALSSATFRRNITDLTTEIHHAQVY